MCLFVVLLFLMLGIFLLCQVDIVVYQLINDILLNFEWGFYCYMEIWVFLFMLFIVDFLEWICSEGWIIIFCYFFLDMFLDVLISNGFLQQIEEDFVVMWEFGVKVIVWFVYIDYFFIELFYLDVFLLFLLFFYIDQFKFLIQNNSDVLLIL